MEFLGIKIMTSVKNNEICEVMKPNPFRNSSLPMWNSDSFRPLETPPLVQISSMFQVKRD
jgi:hypothetical protein